MSWTIPATRSNGAPLTLSELSGYEIYYTNGLAAGTNGAVNITVPVSGGTVSTYKLTGIAIGTYSFSISAIDTAGQKSSLSSVVDAKFGP